MEKVHSTRGYHATLDAYGINPDLLNNMEYLHTLGKFAIAKAGATFEDMVVKKFEPVGCTLLFLLSESHLSFHTYPDSEDGGFISCDMYCCGDADPNIAIDYIIQELKPVEYERKFYVRGVRK